MYFELLKILGVIGVYMRLMVMSDLHLEFSGGYMKIETTEDEANTVLVLAGDIGIAHKPATYVDFLTEMNERFKQIIYIMGNHEHYRGKFTASLPTLQEHCHHLHRVRVVDRETIVMDNVAFVCATMWSDFDKGDPMSMWYAQAGMNDFKIIRIGPKAEPWRRKFNPQDAYIEFSKAKSFIFDEITKQNELGNTVVVVTHHAPSHESAAPEWRNALTAGAYASDLQSEIIEAKPNLFIHGHMHSSSDYMIGDTRVLCNPRGYHNADINPKFDPRLTVEL